jgi:hypothetical protein
MNHGWILLRFFLLGLLVFNNLYTQCEFFLQVNYNGANIKLRTDKKKSLINDFIKDCFINNDHNQKLPQIF